MKNDFVSKLAPTPKTYLLIKNISPYYGAKLKKKKYTCKECEDKVNRKGHLMNPQETFHVDNVKYIIIKSEQNIIPTILKHV